MSLKFKLQDLSTGIRQAVAQAQASVDADPGNSVNGRIGMHLQVETDANRQVKVLVVPEQLGPSVTDPNTGVETYGDSVWGPCPQELRAEGYHDPHPSGATLQGDGGPDDLYIWVTEQGYVPAANFPAGGDVATLAQTAHAAIDALVAKLQTP